MSSLIEIRNLKKIYRMGEEKIRALDDVCLDIVEGEICCLLGTSGSGKSTLLNMIAGLEKPSSGSITIKNLHIDKLNEKQLAMFRQKSIGFVFQSYNLLSTLTALENVTLPLIFNKTSHKERIKRAKKILTDVGLGKRTKHRPNQMSGGQQQRVSIARAFINNPDIIIADEPTGNLDTKTTYEMMDMMTGLVRKNKQTMILVTHDLEISGYANRVVFMRDGKIEKIEVNENPRLAGGTEQTNPDVIEQGGTDEH